MPSSPELEPHPSRAKRHRECLDSEVAVEPLSWHQERSDSKSTCRPARSVRGAASQPTPIEVKMAPVQAVRVITTTRISRSCPSPESSYCSSPRSSGAFPANSKPELADASPAVFEGPRMDCVPVPSRGPLPHPGSPASLANSRKSPADVIPNAASSFAVSPQHAGSASSSAFVQRAHLGPRAPSQPAGVWPGAVRPAPRASPQGSPAASSAAGSPGLQLRSPRQVPRLELDSMPEGSGEIPAERPGSVASPDWSERTCSPHFGARQTIGGVEDVIGVLAN